MQAAIAFGLSESDAVVTQQASFYCPGAKCDFQPLESLAVCSRCSDITNKLKRNDTSQGTQGVSFSYNFDMGTPYSNNTEYRLPNGLFLNNMNDIYGPRDTMVYMTKRGTSNATNTATMTDIDTLIWSQTIINVAADPRSNSSKT